MNKIAKTKIVAGVENENPETVNWEEQAKASALRLAEVGKTVSELKSAMNELQFRLQAAQDVARLNTSASILASCLAAAGAQSVNQRSVQKIMDMSIELGDKFVGHYGVLMREKAMAYRKQVEAETEAQRLENAETSPEAVQ